MSIKGKDHLPEELQEVIKLRSKLRKLKEKQNSSDAIKDPWLLAINIQKTQRLISSSMNKISLKLV